MASWFTVYCSRSVSHVTAGDITAALDAVDFYTVAEGFGIEDEAVVEQALSRLRVETVADAPQIRFRVSYRASKTRPLFIHHWTGAERVREELDEVEAEYLAGRSERGVSQVRKALSATVEVVAVELGLGQLEDMGLVIAGQIAEYFAGVGAGPIRDTGDEWWTVRRGVPKLLLGRE
ncbi:MAG TPA: hypothetical protein VH575_06125 [Gemmataceae bacterium]|jgi:hypothetical protein